MDERQAVIYLTKCALNSITPSAQLISTMDLERVYSYAAQHMLGTMVAMVLETAGYKDERSKKIKVSSLYKAKQFDYALKRVIGKLEEAGVWYVPLKGIVLKSLYPIEEMREMVDHDILINAERRNDVRMIMESEGFSTEMYCESYNDKYKKTPILCFEMHVDLFSKFFHDRIYEYFHNIELIKDETNQYGFHLSNEDLYLYMVAHEYKHYSGSGIGLKSLVDVYVLLSGLNLDMQYVEHAAEKMGLLEFEKNNREMAMHVFGDGELSERERDMLRYIASSGAFGSIESHVKRAVQSMGKGNRAKFKYIVNRISVPIKKSNPEYASYEQQYPLFYKYKIFLPFLPVYRLINSIKRAPGRIKSEISAVKRCNLPEIELKKN